VCVAVSVKFVAVIVLQFIFSISVSLITDVSKIGIKEAATPFPNSPAVSQERMRLVDGWTNGLCSLSSVRVLTVARVTGRASSQLEIVQFISNTTLLDEQN